jgi:hypothetical protein
MKPMSWETRRYAMIQALLNLGTIGSCLRVKNGAMRRLAKMLSVDSYCHRHIRAKAEKEKEKLIRRLNNGTGGN